MPEPAFPSSKTDGNSLPEADVVRVGVLNVEADEVIVGKREAKLPAELVRRYRWNALLLAAVAVLLVLWYETHVRSWATQKVIFGTATVWALFQLVRAWTPKSIAEDAGNLRERFLARRGTRENLWFALVLAGALLLLTSSLYVKLGDRAQPRVRVDIVDSDGSLFMDSLEVEPTARIAGRMFLPRFRTNRLNVVVREPANYRYLHNPLVLRPWSSAELTFGDPAQFGRNLLHVLRVVPGTSLNEIGMRSEYVLTVTVSGERFVFRRCQFETLYLGVQDAAELRRIAKQQTDDAFTDLLNRHLDERGIDASGKEEYLTSWRTASRFEPTRNLREGEQIVVSISPIDAPPTVVATATVSADEMTTIVLELDR